MIHVLKLADFLKDGGNTRDQSKKGEKKTYYCNICLIELNSEDTMISHRRGVKHMKKYATMVQEAEERGETASIREIEPIANPRPTQKKVSVVSATRENVAMLRVCCGRVLLPHHHGLLSHHPVRTGTCFHTV